MIRLGLGQIRGIATAAARTASKPIEGAGTRKFDAHTWSIWAQQMATRGNIEDAVRMLENAVADRKVCHEQAQVLLNTAINICGHDGKFNRAWGIYNDMKKRALKPNDRTVTSVLNALAESLATRNDIDAAATESVWNQAIKIAGEGPWSSFVLNAMLKVCSRLGSLQKLETIFPLASIPETANEISFTLVLNLLARHGTYNDCQVLILEMLEKQIEPSTRDITAILISIKQELQRSKEEWTPKFRAEIAERVNTCLAMCKSELTIPVRSLVLELFMKTRSWDIAADFVQTDIVPLVESCTQLRQQKDSLDSYILSMALKICANHANGPVDVFSFYEKLLAKGLKPTGGNIEALLIACHAKNLPRRALSYFESNYKRKHSPLIPDERFIDALRKCFENEPVLWSEFVKWMKLKHPSISIQYRR